MDADTIDGTKPLSTLGEALVRAERNKKPEAVDTPKPRKKGDVVAKILKIVRVLGTEQNPVTVQRIQQELPDMSDSSISACLSAQSLRQPHLHRRMVDTGKDKRGRKKTKYGYWFNDAYVNPSFGKKAHREKADLKKAKARRAKKPKPQKSFTREYVAEVTPTPTPTQGTSLRISVGEHSFTLEEARKIFEELRSLFTSPSGAINGK